jgi:hypothetical protein
LLYHVMTTIWEIKPTLLEKLLLFPGLPPISPVFPGLPPISPVFPELPPISPIFSRIASYRSDFL